MPNDEGMTNDECRLTKRAFRHWALVIWVSLVIRPSGFVIRLPGFVIRFLTAADCLLPTAGRLAQRLGKRLKRLLPEADELHLLDRMVALQELAHLPHRDL